MSPHVSLRGDVLIKCSMFTTDDAGHQVRSTLFRVQLNTCAVHFKGETGDGDVTLTFDTAELDALNAAGE